MIITLIRHGQTDWNLAGRIQGSTDIPLNDTGRSQASDTVAALTIEGDVVLYSSDLQRAGETARIIARAKGWNEPHVVPALRERSYGEAEGLYDHEFLARYGEWATAEVPGAENRADILDRAIAALHQIAAHVRTIGKHDATVIAVTHGALIASLLRHAAVDPMPQVTNGSAFRFRITPDAVEHVA